MSDFATTVCPLSDHETASVAISPARELEFFLQGGGADSHTNCSQAPPDDLGISAGKLYNDTARMDAET